MSRIRLYVDEDAGKMAVIQGLRVRCHDILATIEAGMSGVSDNEQLKFAAEQHRVIYSFNVGDFAKLHSQLLASGEQHYGIVVIPDQRYSIGEKIRRLADFVSKTSAEEMIDRMVYL
jgi:flavorubredoxin